MAGGGMKSTDEKEMPGDTDMRNGKTMQQDKNAQGGDVNGSYNRK